MSDKRPWNEGGEEKPYSVSLWIQDPSDMSDNDTCMAGEDFATEKEARMCLADMNAHFNDRFYKDVPYVLLDGPNDLHEVTVRTQALKRMQRERECEDRAARSEMAMQAGMGMGIHAYNDMMGYDSEEYDPDLHGYLHED